MKMLKETIKHDQHATKTTTWTEETGGGGGGGGRGEAAGRKTETDEWRLSVFGQTA